MHVVLFICKLILVELFYHYDAVFINCKQDNDSVSIFHSPTKSKLPPNLTFPCGTASTPMIYLAQ